MWTNGVIQDLHVAGSGDSSHASDVNNSGHVVGGRFVGGVRHATLWKDGLAIDLGAGDETLASDITDLGVIVGVGFGAKVGFVWRDSTEGAIDLPPVPGEVESWPWAIAGDFVAGHSNNGAGSIATVWKLQTSVAPPDGDIGGLQDSVDDLANAGTLTGGESNSLNSKLEAANRQCERGNETAARHQIQAFINQVNAMIDSGRIDASTGQALIDDAEALLASLDCSG
jgi:probable HAF family extracellular repeat protein